MRGRGMVEQFLFDGVPVETREGAQPAGDSGPTATASFQIAGEALNVGASCLEQADVMLLAPAGVLAQVQRVRRPGTQPGRAVRAR